jgi:hypothetical protein
VAAFRTSLFYNISILTLHKSRPSLIFKTTQGINISTIWKTREQRETFLHIFRNVASEILVRAAALFFSGSVLVKALCYKAQGRGFETDEVNAFLLLS